MILVNLLPETYRAPRVSPVAQFHRTPLFLIAIGTMAILLVVVVVGSQVRVGRLNHLRARLNEFMPKKQELDHLTSEVQSLRTQEVVFTQLQSARGQWAQHLNTLSNTTPEGVWYTDLSLDPRKGLVIQGSAVGEGGEEMVRIGRLVQDLKDAPGFSGVSDIQIESIKRVPVKGIEIVEFTLTCDLIQTFAEPAL